MNKLNQDERELVARIGLVLGHTEPVGTTPTLLEIDQWISASEALDASRRQQIESHIANDASSFALWQALVEAQRWLDHADEEDNQKLAALGLALGQREPLGARPDLLEIDEWIQGKVASDRAVEITSHIANDSECFRDWRSLCEAQSWLESDDLDTDDFEEGAKAEVSVSEHVQDRDQSGLQLAAIGLSLIHI